ncbi:MAG: hypothetical protein DSZ06_02795 [Sulfurospirillum sp.]|nr:MAG: hypothetical protein DSZ06_02795 [Sulfurospirillum sp.]
MTKITKIMALTFIASLSMSGCKDRSGFVEQKPVSLLVESSQMVTGKDTIVTTDDKAKVQLYGVKGNSVYVNGKKYGEFDENGSFILELSIDHIGSTNYEVIAKDQFGNTSIKKEIQIIRKPQSASLGSISTKGSAKDLTLSQNGTMFVAEGKSGVEFISIGFDDQISSEILASIPNVDALSVTLSSDEKSLFIKDKKGNYYAYDISNPNDPKEIGLVDAQTIKKSKISISKDNKFQIRVSPCGLIGEDIVANDIQRRFLLKDKNISDAILVNKDKQILTAHKEDGLILFSLSKDELPAPLKSKKLDAPVFGLSLIEKAGVLFVAKGDKGVEIFNLDILLSQMK